MSKSYFPADRAGRTAWYDNFSKEFPKLGQDLEFSDAEIANAVNDAKYAVHIFTTLGSVIDADPGHAGNAVLSGQSSGDFIDLPGASSESERIRDLMLTSRRDSGSTPGNLILRNTRPNSGARDRREALSRFRFAKPAAAFPGSIFIARAKMINRRRKLGSFSALRQSTLRLAEAN
jgi:hypothetical protein